MFRSALKYQIHPTFPRSIQAWSLGAELPHSQEELIKRDETIDILRGIVFSFERRM